MSAGWLTDRAVIVTHKDVTLDKLQLELALSDSIWRVVSIEPAPPAN